VCLAILGARRRHARDKRRRARAALIVKRSNAAQGCAYNATVCQWHDVQPKHLITHPLAPSRQWRGNLKATGLTTYAVNDLDMPTSVATTFTGLSAKTIGYSYYADGSRSQMTTPAGNFDYDYDQSGRPTDMTNPNSETTSWDYDSGDRLYHQTLANGAVTTYVYNALNELTSLTNRDGSSNVLSSYSSMSYDGAGNLLEVTASVPAHTAYSGTRYFQYQTDDRLQQEDFGMTTNLFGYDSAGNPTTMRGNSYTFNSRDEITNTGYSYDADGNPTTYNSVSMTYDPENHLVASGSSWTAGYNGDGLQVWNDSGSGKTYTLYDGVSPIINLNSAGTVNNVYSFGTKGLISDAATFYVFDWRGSISERTDGYGNVLTAHSVDSFGTVSNSASTSDPLASFGSQFGQRMDGSGELLLGLRHYDPRDGRFLTRDPIGTVGGPNLYSFVDGNPATLVDPEGLRPITYEDRVRLYKLRLNMLDHGFSATKTKQIHDLLANAILAVKGTTDSPGLLALWWAIDHLGSTDYKPVGMANHCNDFVYDAFMKGANVAMPDRRGHTPGTQLYGANVFGSPGTWLRHFDILASKQPGDVVAFQAKVPGTSGHMTLLVADDLLIYAGPADVKVDTIAINQIGHYPYVIRRHK